MSKITMPDYLTAKVLEIDKTKTVKILENLSATKTFDSVILIENYEVHGFDGSNTVLVSDGLVEKLKQIIEKKRSTESFGLTLRDKADTLELLLGGTEATPETTVTLAASEKHDLKKWLTQNNFKRTSHQEVKQTSFAYQSLDVTFNIETWPSIPPYLEIVGKDRNVILQASSLFGFRESDLITISTKELFKRYSASPVFMSFADKESDITHKTLTNLVHKVIKKHAHYLTEAQVELIANHYILAEYSGKKTHGLRKLCWDVQFYNDRLGDPVVSKDSPSVALLDGQREIGPLAAALGAEIAIKKAKESGVAIVGITGAQRFGVLATWTEMIAKEGLIGVLTTSTEPFTALSETATGVVGTNPLSISVPFKDTPLIYDAAFSKAPVNMMWLYRLLGLNLPDETFIGDKGQYTNDPFRSRYVDVFGGSKGSGFAIMLQILSGPLMGVESHNSFKNPYENAFYFQAIDPSFFQPMKKFEAQVEDFVQFAKQAPLREGYDSLHLPGEKSRYNLDKTIKSGKVRVHTGVVDWLEFLGE